MSCVVLSTHFNSLSPYNHQITGEAKFGGYFYFVTQM